MMSRVCFPLTTGLLLLACAYAYEDPVPTALGIAGDKNAVFTGVLGEPLKIRCLAYGYPPPGVYWFRGKTMVPFNDAVYLNRNNELLIRNLTIDTLGEYTCQAYNYIGRTVSWDVAVKAYRPEDVFIAHKYLVPQEYEPVLTRVPAQTSRRPLRPTTTTTTTTEVDVQYLNNMPVSAHIKTPSASARLGVGEQLSLTCEIDGFPEPEVVWSKNNVRLSPDDKTSITSNDTVSQLTVARLATSDGGLYACHARNEYSSDTATTQITVKQEVVVPAKCTDSPYFANCPLIVRSNYCRHNFYGKFCCKSCVEAGQLAPEDAMQADAPGYRRK